MIGGIKSEISKFVGQLNEEEKREYQTHQWYAVADEYDVDVCLSLCCKPLWQYVAGITDDHFINLMKARKEAVPQFIIPSIKK
jgi:hypothetical protein